MRKTIFVALLTPTFLAAQGGPTFEERMAQRDTVLDGRLGFDVTSQYFFRGILQEDQGLIFQPWLELNSSLWQSNDKQRNLELVFGQWNSLHNGPSAPAGGVWHESRFYTGVRGDISERFHAGARLNFYSNPNGRATTPITNITELQLDLAFDDEGMIADGFALKPYATLAIELDNQRDLGSDEGTYVEVGVRPEFELTQLGDAPVTLSVPVRLGTGYGGYYERPTTLGDDDFFGFLQFGGVVSAPLEFLPAGMGPWMGHAGLHAILLGDNNEARNGGDSAEIFFEFGMSTVF